MRDCVRHSEFERWSEKILIGDGCWEWTAGKHQKGYGRIRTKRCGSSVTSRAHRVSYRLMVGVIPEEAWVLHRCDNPSCVRPSHLFLGNNTDNMRDRSSKGRWKNQWGKGENHRTRT